ncbi:deoxyribose-phosphate aldolase [Bifidobacterium bohemicum]|uniref:Deoxyribose-phosphate aldolase n=1 Tax=Bifidobacterium bohemicum DSM 22767 TaxID=1437606 RepID=A0A086ZJU3_9BIFI|nr:deoxyribose-phosphate aldolase [Bifidobacterium bohemicum]KFI46793.1 deoxyribose-phosphate aldolase [Bifidobacterium bohemicum DSM 22767]SCB81599.1 deoxyribose-phosphate aldolase [Bifidobacterium bohemicum]
MNKSTLSKYIDHTYLKADATKDDIIRICNEAKQYNTASVCVNAYWAALVSGQLAGTDIKTCCVVGFPLGATSTASKAFEARQAIKDGAEEIDMVINIGELLAGEDGNVEADIKAVADTVHASDKLLKVIIETSFLDHDQKVRACELSEKAGADFVKTSTGFSSAGAKADDVALMRQTVGDRLGVKASGGIHSYDEAMEMIDAGADRLGVSATIEILEGAEGN